jgi:tetratricopeptide (TPR) repeat protein
MRVSAVALLTIVAVVVLPRGAALASAPTPRGDAEVRAGWLAFAAPAETPGPERSFEARQQAKLNALPHFEAAVAADPGNIAYQTALAYVYLSAGRYESAKQVINKAIDKRRNDPLLYLLRGQAEAALVQMIPGEVSKRAGPALTAFLRAAELDPKNALPLLQAASVAFDCDRPADAQTYVRKALARPECSLYPLPLPDHLKPQPADWLQTWQYIQLGQWYEIISRCQNVASFLVRLGQEAEKRGSLADADSDFRLARQVGGRIGSVQPHMFISVNAAMEVMEDAYTELARVTAEMIIASALGGAPPEWRSAARTLVQRDFETAKLSPDQQQAAYQAWHGLDPVPADLDDSRWTVESLATFHVYLLRQRQAAVPPEAGYLERWQGETGIVRYGRAELYSALQAYRSQIAKTPPASPEEALEAEAKYLGSIIAGIGIPLAPDTLAAAQPSPAAR